MKKIFAYIILATVLACLFGCGGSDGSTETVTPTDTSFNPPPITDRTFTIEIGTNDFVRFSGNYLVMKADGSSSQKSVEGKVPATYTVKGTSVSCVFQNQGELGVLSVKLIEGENALKYEWTDAAYGVVSLAY